TRRRSRRQYKQYDKARQRCTGLNLNHYKNANEKPQYYPRQPQTFHRHSHEPTSRYYHESGNLGRRVKKTYIPSFPQKQKTKI
ncbi:hypothetical protein, partial [Neisseria meningitidis]|uniref:hypothetical protein n=1 Tax=Neisseria meningitidis TaxID=487 RepID=UPI001C844464